MAFVLKCMSFNLRVAAACDGVNMFFRRAPRVLEVLEREQPDLVGFQEVTDDMRAWLTEHLHGYTLQGCGRERNCHGESMLLGYRTGVCELLALENRWLSPTPDVPGSAFGGGGRLATEWASSPGRQIPMMLYGLIGGAMVIIIRVYGIYPDGVPFAILLINLLAPLLDSIHPKPFGAR